MRSAVTISLAGILLALLSLTATAATVTLKTDSGVQTDTIPNEFNREWIIAEPAPGSSTNALSASDSDTFAHQYSAAAANAGSLAVVSRSHVGGVFDSTGGVGPSDAVSAAGSAEARFVVDDIIFSGPGFTTQTSINFDVSGMLSDVTAAGGAGIFARSGSHVVTSMKFGNGSGSDFYGAQFRSTEHYDFPLPPVVTESEQGDLIGVTFPASFSFGPVFVTLGVAYRLELVLLVSSDARLLGDGSGDVLSLADFGSTMSFPTSGPVFGLADGYSANSVSAGIVDNVWTLTPVSVAAVPLPPAIFGLAGAMCLLARRRRTKSLR